MDPLKFIKDNTYGINKSNINVKGKSVDHLGLIGNNEASAALVSILLTNA